MDTALARIEAALTRIERAAASRPPAALAPDGARDDALAERHERLRTAVAQSLRQLDALIAGASR